MVYDTLRYFATSVEKLAKTINMKKMEHPPCFTNHPKNKKEMKELVIYCKNDADISQQFFSKIIFQHCIKEQVPLKTTISAIAMQEFRTHDLKVSLPVESPQIHDVAFKSYKGGRVEVFQRGTFENVQYYDFTSMYPAVMRNEVPDPRYTYYCQQVSLWDIYNREGACYVEGFQEYRYVPLLMQKMEGKLIAPTGTIKGYHTFIELREALKNGFHITHIGEGVVASRTVQLLKSYVERKHQERRIQKQNNDPLEVMTKLTMNGLYGKFGQKYDTQSKIISENQLTKKMVQKATSIHELSHGFFRIDEPASQPPNHSFPLIASYITAMARIKLWETMNIYQDRLLYCDTDSAFLTNGEHLPDDTTLGGFKHEGDFKWGTFARPKMYGLVDYEGNETIKIKGMKSRIGYDEMKHVMKGKKLVEEHFVKLRTALGSKTHHKFGVLLPNQIIEKEKGFNPNDTKRDWGNEQFDETRQDYSHPLHLTQNDYSDCPVSDN
jgi:DNA polymerase elongation subunit (family B)